MAKVPKAEEVSNIQLAGLAESGDVVSGTRLGHSTPHARSQDIGRFGKFFLWCLGKRPPAAKPSPDEPATHDGE